MFAPIKNIAPWLELLREGGLNRWGVVSAEHYDSCASDGLATSDLAPWARSILVLASGGRGLWDDMCGAMEADHRLFTEELHPLDAHVARMIAAVPEGEFRSRWFLATATAPVQLDFRSLAVLAGVGAGSRLGLVIDPEVGPWLGLRAACFVELELPSSRPAPDVCAGCSAPCMTSCPASALDSGEWNVQICAGHHRSTDDCAHTCHSREACPVGDEHRYSPLQRRYHYDRKGGRVLLRESLGIPAEQDTHVGVGPHWGDWD